MRVCATAGAAGGAALEEMLTRGLPKDEIFLNEDALRQGRTVIIVTSQDDDLLTQSRQLMERNGAESLDAAREKWWIGLPDTAAADYDGPQQTRNEPLYRSGFQAALEPDLRGKPLHKDSTSSEVNWNIKSTGNLDRFTPDLLVESLGPHTIQPGRNQASLSDHG